MRTARALSLFLLAALPLLFWDCGGTHGDESDGVLTIAVIPKGTTHEFWKSIHAGALQAREVLANEGVQVKILWKGPQKEDDREQQITLVEDIINRGVSGIVLAPLDETSLVRPVAESAAASIPVVVIDSGLRGDKHVSFVATDNYKGGALAARHLGTLLGGKGRIIMLRYQEGSESTMQREKGFIDVMKAEFSGIEIASDNQYGGATTESSYQKAEALLNLFPDIDGIFCPNESTTFGMLRALQVSNRAGKVKYVGFDSSVKLVEAMRAGQIHGLILQNPFKMGSLGVRTLVDHLQGKRVEERIDTGIALVTPENMDTPEMKELHSPDLGRWLK